MLQLHVKVDTRPIERQLHNLAREQIPFAIRTAINGTARATLQDVRQAMTTTFDRPTPFTLNAFYVKPAKSKTDNQAWIGTREYAKGGTPAWKYLQPEIEGGPRRLKRFERRLQMYTTAAGMYTVPTFATALDAYGNISSGEITKILAALNAFPDTGQNAGTKLQQKRIARAIKQQSKMPRPTYFIGRGKDGEPKGIYRVMGPGVVKAIMIFKPQPPQYEVSFPFYRIAERSIAANWDRNVSAAIEHALATAFR